MKKTEARILDTFVRVRQHGLVRAAAFPANSRGHELYAAVDTSLKNMQKQTAAQAMHANAAKGKTAQKRVADKVLRDLMETISRTARSMSREFPGAKEKFRLPSKNDGETWLVFARDFSTEAVSFEEEFVRRSMAPDFIDDLKARILVVEQALDARAQKEAEQVAATAGIAEAAEQGLEAVREFSIIARNVYAGSEVELAAWESASHVERAPQRAEEEEEAPPPQPQPAQG